MKEMIQIRISDHQVKDGVQEYNVQVIVPGSYQTEFFGASQQELSNALWDSLGRILTSFGVPGSALRITEMVPLSEELAPVFLDSGGKRVPMSKFAATAKATFKAEVIRDGKVVED